MKGLLLKDLYMMKKYCRSYLLFAVVFIAVSLVDDDNLFFALYPCLLCGMIPVNLLSYDERSRWVQYSGTLPYTKAQIVSAKYLLGVFLQVIMVLATSLAQGIKMSVNGGLNFNEFIVFVLLTLVITTFSSAICLPFIFKLGVEKGRIAYFAMIGCVCASSLLVTGLIKGKLQAPIQANSILAIICVAGIGIYALSWYLSIVFYKNREIG